MGYLDQYSLVSCLLDISEDTNTSVVIDIVGFEVLGIITPDTLDGATNNVTPQIAAGIGNDPTNETFYTPLTNAGAAITWWENIGTDEWLQVPQSIAPVVGARLRLEFSEAEDADRQFYVVLRALAH